MFMLQIDLNLLATFAALYETRSTTLAADRLGLTQSAVSHALRRLRLAVGDPLFVRGSGGLVPTTKAMQMAPEVNDGLAQLRAALAPRTFDPATARRTITIAAGSYFCALEAPELIAQARRAAPGIALRFVPLAGDLPRSLEDGAIDLAVATVATIPKGFRTRLLFRDSFVWVAAAGDPITRTRLSQEAIDAHPKLRIGVARPFGIPDALLAGGGIEPLPQPQLQPRTQPIPGAIFAQDEGAVPVNVVVYDAATAMAVVSRSDLLAQVPRRMVERLGTRLGVAMLDTVEPEPAFDVGAIWHRRSDSDLAVQWLLARLVEL